MKTPSTIFSVPTTQVVLNVHPGNPQVSVNLNNNTSPPSWITFNQNLSLNASTVQPVTLLNYAVGSMAGTVCGMGASFQIGASP